MNVDNKTPQGLVPDCDSVINNHGDRRAASQSAQAFPWRFPFIIITLLCVTGYDVPLSEQLPRVLVKHLAHVPGVRLGPHGVYADFVHRFHLGEKLVDVRPQHNPVDGPVRLEVLKVHLDPIAGCVRGLTSEVVRQDIGERAGLAADECVVEVEHKAELSFFED